MEAKDFGELVDVWAAGVKEMALLLFRAGVPINVVMVRAIQLNDDKTLALAQREQSTAPRLFAPRPH